MKIIILIYCIRRELLYMKVQFKNIRNIYIIFFYIYIYQCRILHLVLQHYFCVRLKILEKRIQLNFISDKCHFPYFMYMMCY